MSSLSKIRHSLALSLAVFLAALPATAAEPEVAAAATKDPHQETVLRIVRALNRPEAALLEMKRESSAPKPGQALPEWARNAFEQEITLANIEQRIVPIYARHLDPVQAASIDRFLRSPAGQKIQTIARARTRDPQAPAPLVNFSDAEKRAAQEFWRTDAGKALADLNKRATADLDNMFRAWGEEIGKRRLLTMFDQLLRDPDAAIEPGGDSPETTMLRQFARVLHRFSKEAAKLHEEYIHAIAKAGLESFLKPDRLVQPQSLQEGRRTVASLQAALRKRQESLEVVLAEANRAIKDLPVKPEQKKPFSDGFEKGLEGLYGQHVAFGENQRRLLELLDRVLSLAEAHTGSLSLQDGRLIFPDNDSLTTFRSLMSEIREESERETEILAKAQASRRSPVQKLREEGRM